MSSQEALFWAQAERFGMPPAMIAEAQRNPALMQMLQSKLAEMALESPKMTTPDMSEQRLTQQIEAAKAAYERDRHAPLRRPARGNRGEYIYSVQAQREQLLEAQQSGHTMTVTSYMGFPKAFSDKPLGKLKRIDFDEMQIPKTHKGRYLLCRIISLPMSMLGTTFIVEDPTGRAEWFSTYHYPLHGIKTGPDLDALFPLGQILAIKEPTFKPNQDGRGHLVRSDSPSDLVLLQPDDPLVKGIRWTFPSAARPLQPSFDHKAHGNNLFKQKKYLLATKAYGDGLATSPPDEQKLLLHLNRAQAHLFLGNFASAYRDASAVLAHLEAGVTAPAATRYKAAVRLARSLEGLRLFDQAKQAYDAVLAIDAAGAEGKAGKQRVEKMVREAKTGEFDWTELKKVSSVGGGEAQVGDFFGPLKVEELKGRGGGRGVVATRDIKAGELLVVEKAFAVGRANLDSGRITLACNLHRSSSEKPSDLALADALVARLLDDPSTLPLVYSLHGGAEYPPLSIAPLGALGQRSIDSQPEAVGIDVARLEEISIKNRFGLSERTPSKHKAFDSSSALFLGTSLFNHSCAPTARWSTVADCIVVRARAPIAAGAEVTISYVSVEAPKDNRDGVFTSHFDGKGCPCSLCVADRSDGATNLARREQLLEKRFPPIEKDFDGIGGKGRPTKATLNSLKTRLLPLVSDLEQTYSVSHDVHLRPELTKVYHVLGELHHPDLANFARDGNKYSLKSLEASGAVIEVTKKDIKVLAAPYCAVDNAASMLINVAWRWSRGEKDEDTDEAVRWIKAAMEMGRIVDGETPQQFALRHKSLIEGLRMEWVVGLAMMA
ncbi:hypothetical protein JCM10213_002916 [Rhodosporidiobolus nylandii]